MSFLAPWYLLGGLAATLPFLLHLIRRTPRGRQPFSSLMFLSPSLPRITRRSRVEHWLLLALRVAAIGLLALAFGRPFLRSTTSLLLDGSQGQQVAILLDTSASMRRGDLWQQAIARANKTLDQLGPNDVVGLFQFDAELKTVVNFPEPSLAGTAQHALIRQSLQEMSPTWHATRLGSALTALTDSLSTGRRDRGGDYPGQVVLISDLQQGADLAALQGYDWPPEVRLQVEIVRWNPTDNAAVRLLTNTAETEPRARISNAADSKSEEFQIGWVSENGALLAATSVYVPAGESRVAKLAERPAKTDRLRLTGDSQDFDNDFFVSPVVQQQLAVVSLGDDGVEDPRGARYFLARVWPETPSRRVTITDVTSNEPLSILPGQRPHLIVVTSWGESQEKPLQEHLQSGGAALFLDTDGPSTQRLSRFLPGVEPATALEAKRASNSADDKSRAAFVLLSEIDFTHPVFAAFADPRFGDFTKVRFWKHQRFQLRPEAKARVLAKFDDGSPALWEQPIGNGRVFVLASSWRPAESQLALSSKFVPLLSSVLIQAAGLEGQSPSNLEVGDSLSIGASASEAVVVSKPDGADVTLPAGEHRFRATDVPGTYLLRSSHTSRTMAVNLALAESDTATMPLDRLEQLGVKTGSVPSHADQAERQRQMRDIELESRQKLWKWLLVVTIAVLGTESTLAGLAAQRQQRAASHSFVAKGTGSSVTSQNAPVSR